MPFKSAAHSFEQQYIPEPNSGCWLWTGPATTTGYGELFAGGRRKRAHRFAYQFFRGPIPEGNEVCHTCDVTYCVNPDHLFVGSHKDNMHDMIRKGRAAYQIGTINPPRGERTPLSKLRETDVLHIRSIRANHTAAEIGLMFGVSASAIYDIDAGRTWAHVICVVPESAA